MYHYPTVWRNGDKVKKNLRLGEVIFAHIPNGEMAFAAKNTVGLFRVFDLTCPKLALKFAKSKCLNEDKF
jgi:hypothetical protein